VDALQRDWGASGLAHLTGWASRRTAAEVAARARLLGLPAAVLDETVAAAPDARRTGPATAPRDPSELPVVDLSSMWAGPLCGQLLHRAGATVVKVESKARPDGTRGGTPAFFDWMNGGKLCYEADFDDNRRLGDLLAAADVVIESSRPAALRHRRLGAGDVAARDGRVWMRISGHGADGERANWPAFADDAAVAGGLVARGGGEVIDVAMAAVAATYASLAVGPTDGKCLQPPPEPPTPQTPAAALGADNDHVERLIAERRLAPC
jgi:hypothetical protein